MPRSGNLTTVAGGRSRPPVRRRSAFAVLMMLARYHARGSARRPDHRAREGRHSEVAATFIVARPTTVVTAVLTDYVRIPHYMPEVRSSQLIERRDDRAVVEQEAVARFLMFSKRIHLILDVEETPLTIAFRDRCGQSFERYEGIVVDVRKRRRTRASRID